MLPPNRQMTPPAGPPPAGPPAGPPPVDPMSKASVASPPDLAMMQKDYEGKPVPSVREFLERMGIDMEGPVTQLIEKTKQNATMMGKAQGSMPPPAPAGPPADRGMASILKGAI